MRRVPRLDTALTIFGMPVGAVVSALLGGLLALQIMQILVSNLWLRGLLSLLAVVVVYRLSLWISDRYGNGAGMRFLRFITRGDVYEVRPPEKEVPLTLSRAGLPEPEEEGVSEDERVWDQDFALSR